MEINDTVIFVTFKLGVYFKLPQFNNLDTVFVVKYLIARGYVMMVDRKEWGKKT